MTYQLSTRLFLENGPAAQAEARIKSAAAAFYLAERARLEAARNVTGAELRIAA